MAIVVALAAQTSLGQLRFFRGVGEVVTLRTQIGHAGAVAASMLRTVGSGLDILVALDSAIEFRATYGAAFACANENGRVTIAAQNSGRGNTLAGFDDTPRAGDEIFAWLSDSGSSGWIALRVTDGPPAASSCDRYGASGASTVTLQEPFVVPTGTPLRFTRRWRLSLYRASDDRWYLGAREWNGSTDRFNAIQPVAGPLAPHSSDPERSGLTFEYRDESGVRLPASASPASIASVSVITRSQSLRPVRVSGLAGGAPDRYADVHVATVALRNRP
jgi:hypothetical protein